MEFNDGSQYRQVVDPDAHMAARDLYMFRAASARRTDSRLYVDSYFMRHRETLAPMAGLVAYQFVWTHTPPEAQADFFLEALGGVLRTNEMVMVDPEPGGGFTNANAPEFVTRWLAVVEPALQCRAWVYVPGALSRGLDRAFTQDRIVMAPHYSAVPQWSHDVHQFTDRGPFPGCPQEGDVSRTSLTVADLLRRCNPQGIACECAEGATRGA
jgi:GH25 family lysozyme M1 (1,4-beta-N-acetylmuramidase)